MRTLFCTNMVKLNMSPRLNLTSKERKENLQKNGEFEDVCTFLTKQAHLGTFTVAALFWTRLSFLTKVANFKQYDICAECFDANFKQQDSSLRWFGQVLAF